MYDDRSSNPITATQGVEMLIGGLQAGLASALGPGVDYSTYRGAGVSAADYNAIVDAHNLLAAEVRRLHLLLEMREHENALLRRLQR